MKRFLIGLCLPVIFLAGCKTPLDATEIANTVVVESPSPPTETPAPTIDPHLILENPLDLLVADLVVFNSCSQGEPFPVWNGMIGEYFGVEYEDLLDKMGRVVGFGTFYKCDDGTRPPDFFVLIEQFDTESGAKEFYDYPFPPEFRSYGYEAKALELGDADEARMRWKRDLEDVPKGTYTVVVEARYYNIFVIVEATGILDHFPAAYAKIAGKNIIEVLK